ncbi:MAG: hypothetical protein HC769_19450 [Cyanobacteria bacterium CRU_2_1]|nr:hypothetical protein [Cyanobacteria bacterium RU_5_0]NJR60804.1 hypothetical protein [Cyanobacteria bacterium CRU_2_1]
MVAIEGDPILPSPYEDAIEQPQIIQIRLNSGRSGSGDITWLQSHPAHP